MNSSGLSTQPCRTPVVSKHSLVSLLRDQKQSDEGRGLISCRPHDVTDTITTRSFHSGCDQLIYQGHINHLEGVT